MSRIDTVWLYAWAIFGAYKAFFPAKSGRFALTIRNSDGTILVEVEADSVEEVEELVRVAREATIPRL